MFEDLFVSLLTGERSQPLSVALVVSALFVPTSLTLYLSQPAFLSSVGAVLLLSVALSLPIVLLSYALWYTAFALILHLERTQKAEPRSEQDFRSALTAGDPLEWPCLLMSGWTANPILYLIAALAYAKPLRIGATFLLTSAVLGGLWLVLLALSLLAVRQAERQARAQRASASGALSAEERT